MKNKAVYVRLIVIYLVIFMIPIVSNIFLLKSISVNTKSNVRRSISVNLEDAMSNLEDMLEEIDVIISKLSVNEKVRYIAMQMNKDNKARHYSTKKEVQNYMGAIKIPLELEEYYLYFHNSSQVISSRYIYYDDDILKHSFQYGELEWDECREIFQKEYSQYIFPEKMTKTKTSTTQRVLYVHSLRMGAGVKGTFFFPIKTEEIRNLFDETYVGKAGWSYIMDKNGEILVTMPSPDGEFTVISEECTKYDRTSACQSLKLNGKDVEVIQVESKERGVIWVFILPQNVIASEINVALYRNLQMIVLAFLIGIITIFIITWKRGKRIDDMLQLLFSAGIKIKSTRRRDELANISDSLHYLIMNNAKFAENIEYQKGITKELLLKQLLQSNDARIEKKLEHYGVRFTGCHFFVIMYRILEVQNAMKDIQEKERIIYKQLLLQKMKNIINIDIHMCDIDIETIALICIAQEYDISDGRKQILCDVENICNGFWEKHGASIIATVGRVYSDISQIKKAYEIGWEILQYGDWSGRNVVDCAEYLGEKDYYYPTLIEEQILNAVRLGKLSKLQEYMEEIYHVNMIENNIDPRMINFLISDLQCTILKSCNQSSMGAELNREEIYLRMDNLRKEKDIYTCFQIVTDILEDICKVIEKNNNGKDILFKQEIIKYIEQNYADPNLSLTMISENFGYINTYFSKMFKDIFQETFVSYLENVRIERVCDLLVTGETMENIASQTGYNSVHVMRAAFKRKKGMQPNEYRIIVKRD